MKDEAPFHVRQGDILLEKVASVPPGATIVPAGCRGNVLALGEGTGHAHFVDDANSILYAIDTEEHFLRVLEGGGLLVHEEHGTIELAPATYRVIRQREYSPRPFRLRRGSALARMVED